MLKSHLSFVSLGVTLAAFDVSAAATSGSLSVTSTVENVCVIVGHNNNMSFGTYYGNQSDSLDQIGSFVVNCSTGTNYAIGLGDGDWATVAGDPSTRRMRANVNDSYLPYLLFQDENYTTIWGSDSSNWLGNQVATGRNQMVDIYGRILGNQSIIQDSYSDVVSITVSYT